LIYINSLGKFKSCNVYTIYEKMVAKKGVNVQVKGKKSKKQPSLSTSPLDFGQKAADWVATQVGSWRFIIFFFTFIAIWMYLNVNAYYNEWDPYPFILLNFVLSCLAAIQAPVILMSQNRQTQRDRAAFRYDYQVNRKAEREVQKILKELVLIKKKVYGDLNSIKDTGSKKVVPVVKK
jgi:uncharacterized membrane protein